MRNDWVLVGAICALLGCGDDGGQGSSECVYSEPEDQVTDPEIHTPRWAFEPWISKDISDGADTRAFIAGFRERDIPVGVVVLDSPWETHYNTFVPNQERYPDFAGMVAELREDGVRTVLWITQMVNQTSYDLEDDGDVYEGASPNFQEGRDCRFFVDRGITYSWWKGFGAGVDFFNPEAVAWWRRQQDALYDMGIAGWKLDFGDEYLPETVDTADGMKSKQEYSERYYQDFYAYGASKLGTEELVTMVRPYDKSYQFEGRFFARPEHAPVAWVGDNRRDWVGLEDALDHLFRSAEAGYVVIGSDVGGYLDVNDENLSEVVPANPETFARWTAVGALTPFMQLHGRANLTPWTVEEDEERIVSLYRYWSWLHSDLVPFFYSLAEQAYAGGRPIMRPIGTLEAWPGDYRYMLGEAFLVAPLLADGGSRDVELPAGQWYDWWDQGAGPIAGEQTLAVSLPDWDRIPLYVKAGAIIPMNVRNDITGIGAEAWADELTLLVYPGGPGGFTVHEEDGTLTTATVSDGVPAGVTVGLTAMARPAILRVWVSGDPNSVTIDSQSVPLADSRATFDSAAGAGYFYDGGNFVYVRVPQAAEASVYVDLD